MTQTQSQESPAFPVNVHPTGAGSSQSQIAILNVFFFFISSHSSASRVVQRDISPTSTFYRPETESPCSLAHKTPPLRAPVAHFHHPTRVILSWSTLKRGEKEVCSPPRKGVLKSPSANQAVPEHCQKVRAGRRRVLSSKLTCTHIPGPTRGLPCIS